MIFREPFSFRGSFWNNVGTFYIILKEKDHALIEFSACKHRYSEMPFFVVVCPATAMSNI